MISHSDFRFKVNMAPILIFLLKFTFKMQFLSAGCGSVLQTSATSIGILHNTKLCWSISWHDTDIFREKAPRYKCPFKFLDISIFFWNFTNFKHITNCLTRNTIFVQYLSMCLAYLKVTPRRCGKTEYIIRNCTKLTLYKKWSFPFRISPVNMTKFSGNCGFGHIYCNKSLINEKLHFLFSVICINKPTDHLLSGLFKYRQRLQITHT